MNAGGTVRLDAEDRRLVLATQAGLPRVPRPWHALGEQLGMAPEEVMSRLGRLLELGVIRRIAAVPNHYALGYVANCMSVWDVVDEQVDRLGEAVGRLDFVSHCYRRPRHPPDWPYNLFAMVHGRTREQVRERLDQLAELLGPHARASDALYSSRILKKTGLRLVE